VRSSTAVGYCRRVDGARVCLACRGYRTGVGGSHPFAAEGAAVIRGAWLPLHYDRGDMREFVAAIWVLHEWLAKAPASVRAEARAPKDTEPISDPLDRTDDLMDLVNLATTACVASGGPAGTSPSPSTTRRWRRRSRRRQCFGYVVEIAVRSGDGDRVRCAPDFNADADDHVQLVGFDLEQLLELEKPVVRGDREVECATPTTSGSSPGGRRRSWPHAEYGRWRPSTHDSRRDLVGELVGWGRVHRGGDRRGMPIRRPTPSRSPVGRFASVP
jgi:hypothetical protein